MGREAFAFFAAIGRPELRSDPRFSSVPVRFANTGGYFKLRADALRAKTTAEQLASRRPARVRRHDLQHPPRLASGHLGTDHSRQPAVVDGLRPRA